MRTYPERPWVGIGVVVHKDEDILLIKRAKAPYKGAWSLPGGAQHIGETVIEGAKREVFEETGIYTTQHHFIDIIDSIHYDKDKGVEYHYTLIEISCLYQKGMLAANDDALCAKWVPYSQIDRYNLREDTLRIITQSYRSRNASLTEE